MQQRATVHCYSVYLITPVSEKCLPLQQPGWGPLITGKYMNSFGISRTNLTCVSKYPCPQVANTSDSYIITPSAPMIVYNPNQKESQASHSLQGQRPGAANVPFRPQGRAAIVGGPWTGDRDK